MLSSEIKFPSKANVNYNLNKTRRTYKFHKNKRIKLIRAITNILILFIILITLVITLKTLYIRNKCKDIYYSIDYYMTSTYSKNNRLLRVKEMNLSYSDEKNVIAIASGLDNESPHRYLSYKISLFKTERGYWKMESIVPIK